ncbi:MAG: Glucose-6-phosphate 1-dehydrogenase [candidate division TM6 bacterium GW2011_GWF2_37_49]|nr:MAG: Glucose-6-phosphate 1-dehydrogenase [candidate division TM6 bacterium GW2011_GWF2_37_49]
MNDFKNSCLNECLFVILGGTGDLAKRKLIPAIYKLSEENKLCKFSVVLVSNLQTNVSQIFEQAQPFITKVNDGLWQKIQDKTRYFKMDFNDSREYAELETLLKKVEAEDHLAGNRIFYFATMPEHFDVISRNFANNKIVSDKNKADACCKSPWSRLVYEKPFGFDLASAKNINKYITQIFEERQIYRIDHYLGKELVGNIALVRFTNQVFEPLWNNKNIDSISINIFEDFGVGARGAFYDTYGAVKDMVQSHMLQILALVAMETPKKLSADFIRDAKANVLNQVEIEKVVLGQYDGYLQEKDVKPNSKTETFAMLKVKVNNKRWDGVTFYLKTGKYLSKREAFVEITFKRVTCLLDYCPSKPNSLIIKINPDQGFYLGLNVKTPGVSNHVTPVSMDFCHTGMFGPNTPEAYEILLSDVIKGDQSAFVRSDEVEFSWKILENINTKRTSVYVYKKGSSGPVEQKE